MLLRNAAQGELEVTQQGERLGFLSDGAFFGEVPILDDTTGSDIRARTITAMTDSRLCFIHADSINQLRNRYPELALRIMRFAKVGGSGMKKNKGLKIMEAGQIKRNLQKMKMENGNDNDKKAVMMLLQKSPTPAGDSSLMPGTEDSTGEGGNIDMAKHLQLMETKLTTMVEAKIAAQYEQLCCKLDLLFAAQQSRTTRRGSVASETTDQMLAGVQLLPGELPDWHKKFRMP